MPILIRQALAHLNSNGIVKAEKLKDEDPRAKYVLVNFFGSQDTSGYEVWEVTQDNGDTIPFIFKEVREE